MRIAITGDNHLGFLTNPEKGVERLRSEIHKAKAKVCCILGDMTGGDSEKGRRGLDGLLKVAPETLFVMGNHDLWTVVGERPLAPDDALRKYQKEWFKAGRSLEKEWEDKDSLFRQGDCVFVGTMGFPDFKHPTFVMPPAYYSSRGCTNDWSYMKLSLGWLHYTPRMEKAFEARLDKALAGEEKFVIVCTHYCIFDCQYKISGDDISAYFFNHGIGQMILAKAQAHPEKTFWCFAGHAHDYCKGHMTAVADNVRAVGLVTDYGIQSFIVFDPAGDFNQDFRVHEAYRESPWT